MIRYIARRLLNMIPILGGVILLTFVLFNLVGGSPAATVLGKNASARMLEDFDEQRGFNKPLLCGWWTRTRAFEDLDLARVADPWGETGGVTRIAGGVALAPGVYPLRLAFPPTAGAAYRWMLDGRLTPGGRARLRDAAGHEQNLDFSNHWKKVFQSLENSPADCSIVVSGAPLELRAIALRRRTAGFFDSQLRHYLVRLARLDFGVSQATTQRVAASLRQGVGPSLSLMIPIFVGGLGVSLALALLCAYRRDRLTDRALVVAATALMSVNYIVWVLLGQYFLAFKLGWFPIWGYESWSYLLLPVLIGMVSGLGRDVRFYRTIMLDEMYKDYVRTARAKGVTPAGILFKHVLRNALVPVITNVSMAIPFLFTGSLLLESFFGIPGLGCISLNAINSSDMDVVRAVVLIGALVYVAVNLVTDLCYAWVDPRIRLE